MNIRFIWLFFFSVKEVVKFHKGDYKEEWMDMSPGTARQKQKSEMFLLLN